ncbi:MAG: hypothetical protein AAGJ56_00850, partial [Myxococcota bacterium]
YFCAMRRVWILAALLAGCGDETTLLRIVDFDGERYVLNDVPRGELASFDPVSGPSGLSLAEASIRFTTQGFPQDGGGDRDRLVEGAREARARIRKDGEVAVAQDLDSLALLTGYVLFARAAEHYESIGVVMPDEPVALHYNPEFINGALLGLPSSDNAAYLPEIDAFAVLPTVALEGIPLAMNPGVVIHEFAHRVFYYVAFDRELFAALERRTGTPGLGQAFNRVRAVEEGVADFFAASFTGDPRFLAASVPGTGIGEERDLEPLRDFPVAWLDGSEPTRNGSFDPYGVGVLFASTLWAMAEEFGHDSIRDALLLGLRALPPQLATFDFQIGDLMGLVIDALQSNQRDAACDIVFERYQAAFPRVANRCP